MSKFKVGDKVLVSNSNGHMCAGRLGTILFIDEKPSKLRNEVMVEVSGIRYRYWIADCDLTLRTDLNNIENLSQQGAQC